MGLFSSGFTVLAWSAERDADDVAGSACVASRSPAFLGWSIRRTSLHCDRRLLTCGSLRARSRASVGGWTYGPSGGCRSRLGRQVDDEVHDLQEHWPRHRFQPAHPARQVSRRHLELAPKPCTAAEELGGLVQQLAVEAIRHGWYV